MYAPAVYPVPQRAHTLDLPLGPGAGVTQESAASPQRQQVHALHHVSREPVSVRYSLEVSAIRPAGDWVCLTLWRVCEAISSLVVEPRGSISKDRSQPDVDIWAAVLKSR